MVIQGAAPISEDRFPIGQRVSLPGHFLEPVTLEAVRAIGPGFECRVRFADGTPDEGHRFRITLILSARFKSMLLAPAFPFASPDFLFFTSPAYFPVGGTFFSSFAIALSRFFMIFSDVQDSFGGWSKRGAGEKTIGSICPLPRLAAAHRLRRKGSA